MCGSKTFLLIDVKTFAIAKQHGLLAELSILTAFDFEQINKILSIQFRTFGTEYSFSSCGVVPNWYGLHTMEHSISDYSIQAFGSKQSNV